MTTIQWKPILAKEDLGTIQLQGVQDLEITQARIPISKVLMIAIPGDFRSPKPPVGGNKGPSYCEKFMAGNCTYGDKCKFLHDFTTDKDLVCTYKGSLGGDQEVGSQYGVVGLCKIPIPDTSEFILIFGQLHSIKGVKISITGAMTPLIVINFQANETVTCVKYLGGKLVYGLYYESTGFSDIRVTNLETKDVENQVSPAHDKQIIGLELFNNFLISISRDGKIKFWIYSAEKNNFVIYSSHGFEGIPSFFNATLFMEKPVLMIGFEEGHLEILNLLLNPDGTLQVTPLSSFKGLHNKPITCISVFMETVLTSSLDGVMKITDSRGSMDSNLNNPIRFFQILKNRKEEDILAIGFENGTIELRKFSNDLNVYGMIPHSKSAAISQIENISHRVNDINFSMLIAVDTAGEVSLWSFK